MRQNNLPIWTKEDLRARKIRGLVYNNYNDYKNYKIYIENPEESANSMICLINQTNQLIDQKLRWLEEKFVNEGGFSENLFKRRLEKRGKDN